MESVLFWLTTTITFKPLPPAKALTGTSKATRRNHIAAMTFTTQSYNSFPPGKMVCHNVFDDALP